MPTATTLNATETGWRLWAITPKGRLAPPFRRGGGQPIGVGWNQGVCDSRSQPWWPQDIAQRLRESMYRTDEHEVAADDCGCGWRFYRSLAELVEGCRSIPSQDDAFGRCGVPVLTERPLAVTRVEVAGRVAGRHVIRPAANGDGAVLAGTFAAFDELHTLRAAYVRVAGPVVVGQHLPRSMSSGLKRAFGSDLHRVPGRLFPALLDGTVADMWRD